MKTLKCKYVSAEEAGGECFQVSFGRERDSLSDYFLIQRVFEEFEEVTDNQIYIESDDETYSGHNRIKEAQFSSKRFYLKLNDSSNSEIEMLFDISGKKYQEIEKAIKTIFLKSKLLAIL